MRTGKLKERKIKLVHKHPDGWRSPDKYYYAEAGEEVYWEGGSNEGYEHCYGNRRVLWCTLWSGEPIGLEESEVDWDDEDHQEGSR